MPTPTTSPTTPYVRYVIVVHGMGEARRNETVISVVNRFAEARRGQKLRAGYDVLTLGSACSHSGIFPDGKGVDPADEGLFCPWLEFRGIPRVTGDSPIEEPFLGEPETTGEQVRFVDCHWADLAAAAYEVAGQAPEHWAAGLIGRLERKDLSAESSGISGQRVPAWARTILRLLEDTLVLLHRLLAWRVRDLDETMFVRYLGDVQVYGEYSPLRGKAVRRFHRLLWRIEQRHEREESHAEALAAERGASYQRRHPRYTIVAHSLGSVMALDALLLAHASVDAKLATSPTAFSPLSASLPFPGFIEGAHGAGALWPVATQKLRDLAANRLSAADSPPSTESEELRREVLFSKYGDLDSGWVARVDSFVTLGSPIDKFLVLWWLTYRFLRRPDDWLDAGLAEIRKMRRIRHFNYVDEQDPVGHRLDIARTAPAIYRLFDSERAGEDLVYNRFPVPGLAHLSYWKDLPLFSRILRHAVDGERLPSPRPAGTFYENLRRLRSRRWDAPIGAAESDDSFRLHDDRIYQRILSITYRYVPGLFALASTLAFWWAYRAEGATGAATAALVLLGLVLIGRRLLDLLIWWRGVLTIKGSTGSIEEPIRVVVGLRWAAVALAVLLILYVVEESAWETLPVAVLLVGMVLSWRAVGVRCLAILRAVGWNPKMGDHLGVWDVATRHLQSLVFRQDLAILQLAFLGSFATLVGGYRDIWATTVDWGRLGWVAVVLGLGMLVWRLVARRVLRAAEHRNERGAERASLVLLGLSVQLAVAAAIGWALGGGIGALERLRVVLGSPDWLAGQAWLSQREPLFALLAAAGAAAAAVTFGYVRYRRWQVHLQLTEEPVAGSLLIHLLLFLPEPLVRQLGGRAAPRSQSALDFDVYAAG